MRAILGEVARRAAPPWADVSLDDLWPGHLQRLAPNGAASHRTPQRIVTDCKLLHRGLEQTVRSGAIRTRACMERCGADEGHLVVFDRSPDRPWEQKLFRRQEANGDAAITVWGMWSRPVPHA